MTIWTLTFEIQPKAIRTNVSRNTTMVTNISSFRTTRLSRVRFNKGFRIRQISYGFHTFITFLRLGHKDSFDLESVEEEGQEETTYPKPFLSELGF